MEMSEKRKRNRFVWPILCKGLVLGLIVLASLTVPQSATVLSSPTAVPALSDPSVGSRYETAAPPIPPGELHLIVPTPPITPERTSDLDFTAEIPQEELEAAKAHVEELEADFKARVAEELGVAVEEIDESVLANLQIEADHSACKPPVTFQLRHDCSAHTVAAMINVLERFEGNWGGNPYPWDPEFSVSPLWFTARDPWGECVVSFYGALLDAIEYGALTEDRLSYTEYEGDCYVASADIDPEDPWAKPLRLAGFSIVYLRDKENPEENMGSKFTVIETMNQGHSVGLGYQVESGEGHGVLVLTADQQGVTIVNWHGENTGPQWRRYLFCYLGAIRRRRAFGVYVCRPKNYRLWYERCLEPDR